MWMRLLLVVKMCSTTVLAVECSGDISCLELFGEHSHSLIDCVLW